MSKVTREEQQRAVRALRDEAGTPEQAPDGWAPDRWASAIKQLRKQGTLRRGQDGAEVLVSGLEAAPSPSRRGEDPATTGRRYTLLGGMLATVGGAMVVVGPDDLTVILGLVVLVVGGALTVVGTTAWGVAIGTRRQASLMAEQTGLLHQHLLDHDQRDLPDT